MKGKLENGEYASYAQAAYDMRLIWYNSMLYNTPGIVYSIETVILKLMMIVLFDSHSFLNHVYLVIDSIYSVIICLLFLIGSKIYSFAKVMSEYWEAQCAINFPSDPDRLPSNEEMSQWVQQCHRLSSEELGLILKKIDEAQPDCLFKVIQLLELLIILYE